RLAHFGRPLQRGPRQPQLLPGSTNHFSVGIQNDDLGHAVLLPRLSPTISHSVYIGGTCLCAGEAAGRGLRPSALFTAHGWGEVYFSPALRRAARWRSNTAGSLMGMRCRRISSENCGFSRSTSAASTRASAAWPNSL